MGLRILLIFCLLLLSLRNIVHSVRAPLTPEQKAELPWKRTSSEAKYLEANVQEHLLNFEFLDADDNTIKNMGEVFESLLHDIINQISPPMDHTSL